MPVKRDWGNAAGIFIEGCPLVNPPYEIAIQGTQAILAYWAEQDRIGSDPLQEIKLFLLGNSTAGKSTLREALIQGEYDDSLSSTHGAELARVWQDGDTRVNIWDFGGQEYFHATYRLLMNDRAVYALLIDPQYDADDWKPTPVRNQAGGESKEEDMEHFHHRYWLETIHRNAPSSKVHVIWNKLDLKDRARGELDSVGRKLFQTAQLEEFEISLMAALLKKEEDWIVEWSRFKKKLQRNILARLQDERVLKYWPAVRQAVEVQSITALSISRTEFDALVLADDSERNVELCILYLRDICGSILYWGDHALLRDRVFINPNRLNDLIYRVLSPEVKRNGGQFTRERVRGVVEEAQGQSDHALADALIAVMQQFRIIFAVKGQAHTYVAPQYLPLPTPALLQAARAAMGILDPPRLVLRFDDAYIPRHVFPVFLTEAGPLATLEECWKTAVLYGVGEARVMVEVDHSARSITLRTDGSPQASPALLRVVLHSLAEAIGPGIPFSICIDPAAVTPVWLPYRRLCDAARIGTDFVADQDECHHPIAPWLEWLMDVAPQQGPRSRQHPADGREEEAFEQGDDLKMMIGKVLDNQESAKKEHDELKVNIELIQQQGQDNQKAVINKLESIDKKIDIQLNRILTEIQSLQGQNGNLHNDLQTIFQRIKDNAELNEGLLQHLIAKDTDQAIEQALKAIKETKGLVIEDIPAPAPTASKLEKLGFIKLKLSTLTLVAAALAATPAVPIALPALLAASTINVEATLPEALRGIWKLLRKIAEPFQMDQR